MMDYEQKYLHTVDFSKLVIDGGRYKATFDGSRLMVIKVNGTGHGARDPKSSCNWLIWRWPHENLRRWALGEDGMWRVTLNTAEKDIARLRAIAKQVDDAIDDQLNIKWVAHSYVELVRRLSSNRGIEYEGHDDFVYRWAWAGDEAQVRRGDDAQWQPLRYLSEEPIELLIRNGRG